MTWWQALAAGSGAGGTGLFWRVLRSRKLRQIAADVLDGPDTKPNADLDALVELRVILDEQRRGYEHLAGRVETLETTIAGLEQRLADEQDRANTLERQLRRERKDAGLRIGELERQLAGAQARIDHLEALLALYQAGGAGPDGATPTVEDH